MPCKATQDGWIIGESSDKTWPTGEENAKQLQCFCLENPMNRMKRQKDRTLEGELPRSEGAPYATEEKGEITPKRMKRRSQNEKHTQLWM